MCMPPSKGHNIRYIYILEKKTKVSSNLKVFIMVWVIFFFCVVGLYVAPEIYRDEIFDRSVDAYSFGLILYEVRTSLSIFVFRKLYIASLALQKDSQFCGFLSFLPVSSIHCIFH